VNLIAINKLGLHSSTMYVVIHHDVGSVLEYNSFALTQDTDLSLTNRATRLCSVQCCWPLPPTHAPPHCPRVTELISVFVLGETEWALVRDTKIGERRALTLGTGVPYNTPARRVPPFKVTQGHRTDTDRSATYDFL